MVVGEHPPAPPAGERPCTPGEDAAPTPPILGEHLGFGLPWQGACLALSR
jgi:hypothetical protein